MHDIFQDFYKVAFDSLSDIAFVFTLVGVYIFENIDFNNESNGKFLNFTTVSSILSQSWLDS